MAGPGRNDPCACGSGKKYKKCCLPGEETVAQVARQAAQASAEQEAAHERALRPTLKRLQELRDEDQDWIDRSNAVLELIHSGSLDDAEVKARELIESHPHVSDGLEHLGFVYEKRGDHKTAGRYYREAAAFCRENGIDMDDHIAWLLDLAEEVDPAPPPSET
jgi:tetratricopeptide (TPR) repeat protein